MKRSLALNSLLFSPGLSGAAAQSAEFASADCVTGLNEIGLISVDNIFGSPQDVERVIALKADEQGASWYRIIHMQEEQRVDNWRAQAILYA
ncbi:DUF1471 domain-containing protein [Metakosakonia massiliensis]|uniref:YdgH/BhsA/McbA-like domain-containing protein n=1 Tax=Phytobacter massiliensis TaxID=1485952 RepID=A0A6N3F7Z9_9ENTR|nr:DUF1471 family protease activator YjfN [Phytobacter massiliensis]